MEPLKPTLVLDLDNTMIECKQYYDVAIATFAARTSARTGLSEEFCQKMLSSIDLASCHLPGGFSRDRFPRSFRAAALALDVISDRAVLNQGFAHEMYELGNAVFDAPYLMYEGVEETLEKYVAGGWQLAICSKGVPEVQWRKLRKNGLDKWFDEARVYITLQKSPELLRRIVSEHAADPERTWVVGDSIRDDIGPAKAADLGAVEVVNRDGVWGYESEEHAPHATVAVFSDLSIVIPYDASHSSAFTAELRRKAASVVP